MRTLLAVLMLALLATTVNARWKPEYAANGPELREWFNSLRSPRGVPCCDTSDGHRVDDTDVQTKDGHYQVRIGGTWRDVAAEQVLDVPNRLGQPIVWFMGSEDAPRITCFLPGAGF